MRGRGSAGRASPCQGEGRGFESRRPLGASLAQSLWGEVFPGGVAERRGNGLQIRVHGFKSRLHLGRLAQRERASLTRKRSLVQIQYRPPASWSDRLSAASTPPVPTSLQSKQPAGRPPNNASRAVGPMAQHRPKLLAIAVPGETFVLARPHRSSIRSAACCWSTSQGGGCEAKLCRNWRGAHFEASKLVQPPCPERTPQAQVVDPALRVQTALQLHGYERWVFQSFKLQ